ncbi:MAG: hypothetical protein ACREC0_00040 [Methylocella sp.]
MPATDFDARMRTCPRGIVARLDVPHPLAANGNPKLAEANIQDDRGSRGLTLPSALMPGGLAGGATGP